MVKCDTLRTFVDDAEDALGGDVASVLEDVQNSIAQLHAMRRREQYLASVVCFVTLRASLIEAISQGEGSCHDDGALGALTELQKLQVWPGTRLAARRDVLVSWGAEAIHFALKRRVLGALETLGYPKTSVDSADLGSPSKAAAHNGLIAACAAMYRLSCAVDSADSSESIHARVVGVLMEPIAVRFEFNFGDAARRPTARVDRPEWPLASALTTLRTHTPLFVDAAIDTSALASSGSKSATEAFADAVVAMAAALFKKRAKAMMTDTLVLCKAVAEAVSFDAVVHSLVPGTTARLSVAILLDNGDLTPLCTAWIAAESAAAMAAFDALEADVRAGKGVSDELLPATDNDPLYRYATLLSDAAIEIVRPLAETMLLSTETGLPGAAPRCALLRDAIVPVLSTLHARLSYAVPAGLGRNPVDDIPLAAVQANAVASVVSTLSQWGESLGAIETAASPAFEDAFGYDASSLEGTIFGKALVAFRDDLLKKRILLERIEVPAWDAWATPLASFARAMHYGVRRPPGVVLAMHDELRRANAALADALLYRASRLDPTLLTAAASRVLARCDTFYADRVLLTNIYAGREATTRAAADVAATRASLAEIASRIGLPADIAVLPLSSEAVAVIDADDESVAALREAIAADDMAAATATARALGVRRLTLEHVEQLLSLVRDAY